MQRLQDAIRGHALGDAVGMGTEFFNEEQLSTHKFTFPRNKDDAYRGWPANDWTDDTDQLVCAIRAKCDPIEFAKNLRQWANKGFPELGDKRGLGAGGWTMSLFNDESYVDHPIETAVSLWKQYGCKPASNGGMMRVLALLTIPKPLHTVDCVGKFMMASHPDPRCIVSAYIYMKMLEYLIDDSDKKDIVSWLESEGAKMLQLFSPKKEAQMFVRSVPNHWPMWHPTSATAAWHQLFKYDRYHDIIDIRGNNIGFVFVIMGVAIVTFKQLLKFPAAHNPDMFKTLIAELSMQGGDADTNCAIAGAMIGAKFSIPEDWYKHCPNHLWLENEISHVLK